MVWKDPPYSTAWKRFHSSSTSLDGNDIEENRNPIQNKLYKSYNFINNNLDKDLFKPQNLKQFIKRKSRSSPLTALIIFVLGVLLLKLIFWDPTSFIRCKMYTFFEHPDNSRFLQPYQALSLNDTFYVNPEGQKQREKQNNFNPSSVLLVTAFFPIKKAKPDHAFMDWLPNFFAQIKSDTYVFTTPEFAETINQMRKDYFQANNENEKNDGNRGKFVIDTRYANPTTIPVLSELIKVGDQQHDLDPEARIHSPDLYYIWNAKPFLLCEAKRQMISNNQNAGSSYDYYFWQDAGAFRQKHVYSEWPNLSNLNNIWLDAEIAFKKYSYLAKTGLKKEDLLFMPINGMMQDLLSRPLEKGPAGMEMSEGSFLGGTSKAIEWFETSYYKLMNDYLMKGYFVGKDQSLFNAMMFAEPERFLTYLVWDPTENRCSWGRWGCGDYWYFYQYILAKTSERTTMRSKNYWNRPERSSCRIPQVMTFWELHKKVYNLQIEN